MSIENPIEEDIAQRHERDMLGWMSDFFRRKIRSSSSRRKISTSSSQEVEDEHNTPEDSRAMRIIKAKNLQLYLSEIMRKLKLSFKKEKPQHDKRLLGKKFRLQRSLSPTKDHFFLERMTSVPPKRSHHEHYDIENQLSEMLNNEDFDPNLAASKHVQSRIVLSPLSSLGRIWNQDSTVLSMIPSDDFMKSETISDDSIAIKEMETADCGSIPFISKSNQVVDDISKVEASDGYKECEILKETSHVENLPQLSLFSVNSPSHCRTKSEDYKLLLEQLFVEYEISPARGEAQEQPLCIHLQDINHMDVKESVFKYVKAVLDAIDSSWEELYLNTELSDQILNPALISNIPFYPNHLCADHELLFDCINEVLFEFCRFPRWLSFVNPRTQVFSYSVESIVREVQEKVYCRLLPSQLPQSLDQLVREELAQPQNWLDIRCDLEWIGFETSEIILDELLEALTNGDLLFLLWDIR